MSEVSDFSNLGETPQTDADHCSTVQGFARGAETLAEALREHIENLLSEVNMTDSIMNPLRDAADHFSEAAECFANHITDYEEHYAGVREAMASGDGKVPGMDPNNAYWSETA